MTILRQFYQSCAPFCISNLLNFWFPDVNLWVNGQMCYMTFRHFLLKILQNNFSIWTYKVTLASGNPWPTTFYFYIVVELLALRVRLSFFCCIVKLYIFRLHILYRFFWSKYICTYICKTQIDVQSSNRCPILKYMAVFHFLKSTSNDVYFKRRHTRKGMFWSNDGEGTRPDSRWGVLDDKNAYVFYSYCR